MFVVILTYKKPLKIVDQHVTSHRNFLDQCYQKNYFIASGPQQPRTGGVILSQLRDRHQLELILKEDPFFQQDIAEYQIIEFTPVKHHPQFANFL